MFVQTNCLVAPSKRDAVAEFVTRRKSPKFVVSGLMCCIALLVFCSVAAGTTNWPAAQREQLCGLFSRHLQASCWSGPVASLALLENIKTTLERHLVRVVLLEPTTQIQAPPPTLPAQPALLEDTRIKQAKTPARNALLENIKTGKERPPANFVASGPIRARPDSCLAHLVYLEKQPAPKAATALHNV